MSTRSNTAAPEPAAVEVADQAAMTEMPEPEPVAVAKLKQQGPRDLRAQKHLAAVCAGFVLTFILAFYVPSARTVSELQEQILTGAQQLQSNRERGRALPELRARSDRLENELSAFRPLASEGDVPAIVNQTVSFGSISQLRAFVQQQMEPSIEGPVGVWPIRMSFEGNFENVFSFLRRCEQLPNPVRISEMTIRAKNATSSEPVQAGDVVVNMVLNVYFRPEPVAAM